MKKTAAEVDQYISKFPQTVQDRLRALRHTILKAAPEAEEGMGYGMPAYKYAGPLVYFAAYKNHIGFYPVPSGIEAFKRELAPYAAAKGTARFPHDGPIPYKLIAKIVTFRLKENAGKAQKKKTAKTCSKGHRYYKTSDCPSCPICEAHKLSDTFVSGLGAPARRALDSHGIKDLKTLSSFTEEQLLALHGLGPSSLPKIKNALQAAGLALQQSR